MPTTASRRYALGFTTAVILVSAGVAAINTRVNPLRMTRVPWTSESLDPYRDISSQERTGRAGIILSAGRIDVAFIGSSRVANAFDPSSSLWKKQAAYNLGCKAGYFHESARIARFLIARHQPEIVFLGIDPGDFSSDLDTRPIGDFYASPFSDQGDSIDRSFRYLLGFSSLDQSLDTLKRKRAGLPAPFAPDGGRTSYSPPDSGAQRRFIRERILAPPFVGNDGRTPRPPNQEKLQLLTQLVQEMRDHGTRLVLFLHPRHAVMNARAEDIDRSVVLFATERPALVDAIARGNAATAHGPAAELWDFYDFHPLNCEPLPIEGSPRMKYWDDLGHYTPEIADLILTRMMGKPPAVPEGVDYGLMLTAENLPKRLQNLPIAYRHYLSESGKRDVTWKEEVLSESAQKP